MYGLVSAVISEDTDMIAFGARVVFFKMDKVGFQTFPLGNHMHTPYSTCS
jgi:hypothetical protein